MSDAFSLAVFDDGSGPALYAGGDFTTAGGVAANGIAKWDGSSWSPLGSGLAWPSGDRPVYALAVFDDGGGAALYAGGALTSAGGVSANRIARWDGSSWTPVDSGVSGGTGVAFVSSLAVHDDGSGPALFVGGNFTFAGAVPASRIGGTAPPGPRWGAAWEEWYPWVTALTAFDDGSGQALFTGGRFQIAGGRDEEHRGGTVRLVGCEGRSDNVVPSRCSTTAATCRYAAGGSRPRAAGRAARREWDAESTPLAGFRANSARSPPTSSMLTVFDNGNGPALYASGSMARPRGVDARHHEVEELSFPGRQGRRGTGRPCPRGARRRRPATRPAVAARAARRRTASRG
jgi:hypothetical protein